jgi:hypothetical protein
MPHRATGLRVGDRHTGLFEALTRGQDSFNSYALGRPAQAGAIPSLGETKLRTTDITRERIKAMDVIIG